MSKAREFWIDNRYPTIKTNVYEGDTELKAFRGKKGDCIHVIEKSAADKLAEAIEDFMKKPVSNTLGKTFEMDPNQMASFLILGNALKDYRGEK